MQCNKLFSSTNYVVSHRQYRQYRFIFACLVIPFSLSSPTVDIGDMLIVVEMLFFAVLSRIYFRGRVGNIDLSDDSVPVGGRMAMYGPYTVVTVDQDKANGVDGTGVGVNSNCVKYISGHRTTEEQTPKQDQDDRKDSTQA